METTRPNGRQPPTFPLHHLCVFCRAHKETTWRGFGPAGASCLVEHVDVGSFSKQKKNLTRSSQDPHALGDDDDDHDDDPACADIFLDSS